MIAIIVLIVIFCLSFYFSLYKTFRSENPSDIADSLVVYEELLHNKSEYIISYDPIHEEGLRDPVIHRREAFLVKTIDSIRYSNGEFATVILYTDIDWYIPNDLVTVEDKLDLLILSNVRRLGLDFYYLAAPLKDLNYEDYCFAKAGAKLYRLNRKLTESENEYLIKNKVKPEVSTYKFKDFNPPYEPHKQGGYVSASDSCRSNSNDIVDDIMMNPLLSPISPINIWSSNDDKSSSSCGSSDNSGNYGSGDNDDESYD